MGRELSGLAVTVRRHARDSQNSLEAKPSHELKVLLLRKRAAINTGGDLYFQGRYCSHVQPTLPQSCGLEGNTRQEDDAHHCKILRGQSFRLLVLQDWWREV